MIQKKRKTPMKEKIINYKGKSPRMVKDGEKI